MEQEKVIKPHLVKPMLEKVVFEKMQLPAGNTMINIKPEDSIDVRKVSEEVCASSRIILSEIGFISGRRRFGAFFYNQGVFLYRKFPRARKKKL